MKIALLGLGKEGQAAKTYFSNKYKDATFDIYENLTPDEFAAKDYSSYDIISRSPSVPPFEIKSQGLFTSSTKYFFDHCPCPIIGVTATKGKGTTCSFIKAILDSIGEKAYLVGNIGTPAISVLDKLTPNSVVVYEMSSFQLWDLTVSPHVAVIGTIEPDHLNVHHGFDDYTGAKSNICRHQSTSDYCIYYSNNKDSVKIAETSKAKKIPYPFEVPEDVLKAITLPGRHNAENAIAAIAAVASYLNISPAEFLSQQKSAIMEGLSSFHGLPHRLEFVREVNGIRYYDDNFSTNPSSTRVAINAFPDNNLVVIAGGRDKTNNEDIPEIYEILCSPNIKKVILMGESGHEIAKRYEDPRFEVAESLESAVNLAKTTAESLENSVVVMSPSAASFDMFKDVYDRGDTFKKLINSL